MRLVPAVASLSLKRWSARSRNCFCALSSSLPPTSANCAPKRFLGGADLGQPRLKPALALLLRRGRPRHGARQAPHASAAAAPRSPAHAHRAPRAPRRAAGAANPPRPAPPRPRASPATSQAKRQAPSATEHEQDHNQRPRQPPQAERNANLASPPPLLKRNIRRIVRFRGKGRIHVHSQDDRAPPQGSRNNQALGDAVHHLMYCAKMCLSLRRRLHGRSRWT